jgi:hypothetical protein
MNPSMKPVRIPPECAKMFSEGMKNPKLRLIPR